jgi:hypothetical protein
MSTAAACRLPPLFEDVEAHYGRWAGARAVPGGSDFHDDEYAACIVEVWLAWVSTTVLTAAVWAVAVCAAVALPAVLMAGEAQWGLAAWALCVDVLPWVCAAGAGCVLARLLGCGRACVALSRGWCRRTPGC